MTLDFAEKLTSLGIGISGFLFTILYRCYQKRMKTANQIKLAERLKIDPELRERLQNVPEQSIAYAMVEGIVGPRPNGQVLRSHHDGSREGVIRETSIVEHRSKRVQGFWSDERRTIRDSSERLPFCLFSLDGNGSFVEVREVQNEVECLSNALTTTYESFTPVQSGIIQAGIDRLFGEVTKGFQETERMLVMGTKLIGVGEVLLDKDAVVFGPPHDNFQFILTHLSRRELIRKFEGQAFWFKVLTVFMGTLGTGLIIYLAYRLVRRWKVESYNQRMFEEAHRGALRHQSWRSSHDTEELDPEEACVVCLTNPREVIMLECGHACLCTECAAARTWTNCPVCRQPFVRFIPLYRP